MNRLNPSERKKFWKEFDRDSLIAAITMQLLQFSYPILIFIFWDKGLIKVIVFIISWVAWHKFWGNFINKIFEEKWEWTSTEQADFVKKRKGK